MEVNSFKTYLKEDKSEVVFAFGRFNPPTIGHEKLFDAVKKLARGSQYRVYPSQSQDPKKNPLDFKLKVKFLRKMFPKHARNIMADKGVRNAFDVVVKLYDQGYTKVTMVAGEDRVVEFEKLLNKYNGTKGRHGFYQFENGIVVKSAGARDPDAEGATGMSASKLRAAANDNDLKTFAKGMPKGFKDVEGLFNAVRAGMGLSESKSFRKHVQLEKVSDVREEYVEGTLFIEGDEVVLKKTDEVGTIKVCGSNYVIVQLGENKKRVWLDDVEKINEQYEYGTKAGTDAYKKMTPGEGREDPDIGDRKGSQPAKYYNKDMSVSTKKKRDAHFKKKSTKPAPGDAKAKTKPSTHTKKFAQMFGENEMKSFKDHLNEADVSAALKKKAEKSGMPVGILRKVFNRGVAAWKTGHRPGTTAVQWGLARVNSFATKSKGTWGKADKDLAAKVRG
tara:strand:+ start:453 stop:1793 length:1341 start_codon:yes stop_codon:yes gene_type:complete